MEPTLSLNSAGSAAASDGEVSGLQGCCSQSSLNSNGSLPSGPGHRGSPERRVASWAVSFERLLQDPVGVRYFSEFLKKEFSEENILFWQACESFSYVPESNKKLLSQRAREIYNSFLSSKATTPVNIDSQAQLADDVLTSPRPDMFKAQQLQIFNLMKFDSYSRFLKSPLYQECMLAEVEWKSLPDPQQIPSSPAPSKHSSNSEHSTFSTPKKEARKPKPARLQNDNLRDDQGDKKRGIFFSWTRNRSFGKGAKKRDISEINQEYWGNSGRRESQGSLSSGASLELPASGLERRKEADFRNSVSAWEKGRERSPRQCNMTLPDGSTSSVVLRPGASIRDVLRDLCQNLRVNLAAVDLFLAGGEKPLVLDQDCMTLSSRDLRLEKRTLFRLDLVPINRSVGLKAKPTKPVTEVLRPVVAKYGLHLSDLVAKISGEIEPLDLGAPISSLDGKRVVLEKADLPPGKDRSKLSMFKSHTPALSNKKVPATADGERLSDKAPPLAAGGADQTNGSARTERGKPKSLNVDEAEEFFDLLSRAQSARTNDQRGLLNKDDLILPDFLRLAPPPGAEHACSTPQGTATGRCGVRRAGRGGALTTTLRSESLDSSLLPCANGYPEGHRAGQPRHPVPFSPPLSPILCSSKTGGDKAIRTMDEDTLADLTLVGEGDITSPNSTLMPPSPTLMSHKGSFLDANFTPPSPCFKAQDSYVDGQSSSGISKA